MKPSSLILLIMLFVIASCIEEYEIQFPDGDPRLVVDVLISDNEEISHATIGWTYPAGEGCYYEDNWGKFPMPCEPDDGIGPFLVTGFLEVLEVETGTVYHDDFEMGDRKSFITLPIIVHPTPGYHYRLHIQVAYAGDIQDYFSETMMNRTPPIEAITYEVRAGDVGKSDSFVPLISFTDASTKDYYLFHLCGASSGSTSQYCSNSRVWSYSVLSDQFLPTHVDDLSIDDGATVARYADFYPPAYPGSGAQVRMYCVSRNVYEFYKSLLDQFVNDGGAYAPTPSTPEGNISNGAIGLFRVLNESSATVYY